MLNQSPSPINPKPETVEDIIVDRDGNIIVTGAYDSNSGLAVYNSSMQLISPPGYLNYNLGNDVEIVAKFDMNGNALWGAPITTAAYGKLASDSQGDIVLCSTYSGSSKVYNSSGVAVKTLPTLWANVFVVKFSSSGSVKMGHIHGFAE